MRQILQQLENFFPLLRHTVLPALLFAIALLGFYLYQPIAESSLLALHRGFFSLSLAGFLILLYFNQSKPAFFILTAAVGYVLINLLKRIYSDEYILSPEFINLSILVPLNLALFYYLPPLKLLTRRNVYLLLFIFAEYALAEKISLLGFSFGSSLGFSTYSTLNNLSLLLFGAAVISFFITCSITGKILDTSLFFAALEICLGFYYSPSPTAITVFFSASALTIVIAVSAHIYYTTYRDQLTGLASRNSFILHARDFPLKYSIGIILIDDYERLSKVFGKLGLNALVKMISLRISETETEAQIYRYSEDEFVVLFRGEDKNSAFERMENIRRAVASAEFMLRGYKKPIKLTVSGSISEKKRSDANAVEVLVRADKALQKAYRFTQNITSKA